MGLSLASCSSTKAIAMCDSACESSCESGSTRGAGGRGGGAGWHLLRTERKTDSNVATGINYRVVFIFELV